MHLLRQPVRHDRHFHWRVFTDSTLPIGKAAGIANSNGSFYVEDLANNLLLVDPVTGASHLFGNTRLGLEFVVFAGGDSGLYGIDHASNLYSFNSQNGTAALIGNTCLAPNNGPFDTSLLRRETRSVPVRTARELHVHCGRWIDHLLQRRGARSHYRGWRPPRTFRQYRDFRQYAGSLPESGDVITAASGLMALALLVRRKRHTHGITR